MTDCTATTPPPECPCEACGEKLSGPTFGKMHQSCVRRLLDR